MDIVIIGSGNVGNALGHLCHRGNHNIVQVFGRNPDTVHSLAQAIDAEPVTTWQQITTLADLYIVALPDTILPQLHTHFTLDKGLVVHTAGSVSIKAIAGVSRNFGVLYPLQSLHKKVMTYSNIPLLVDGNTIEDKTLIADFAATISGRVAYADDTYREQLHLAAVWVNNFANHLYTIGYNICTEKKLDFSLLLPMMEQTVNRLHVGKPSDFQTGPAMRGDQPTLLKHLALMDGKPDLQEIYTTLSKSIEKYY